MANIPDDVKEKLAQLRGTERRFEEILLGVATYQPAGKEEFFYTVNGMNMRLRVEKSNERIANYLQYIDAYCQDDWFQELLDPLKLLFRLTTEMSHHVLHQSCLGCWSKVAKKIKAHTDFLTDAHKEYF